MASLSFTDEELHERAVHLGLMPEAELRTWGGGMVLPAAVRAKAAASLAADQRAQQHTSGPRIAKVVTVRPGRGPLVDGKPFPWVITDDAVSVEVRADGSGFVRLTIPAELVRIDAETETPQQENRA
ncbi:hypothetical protein [Embleya sp. NPDC001921]